MATKIRTAKEIFGEFNIMQELSDISATISSKYNLYIIKTNHLESFKYRMNMVERVYHILCDSDIVYIAGQYGCAQSMFAKSMVQSPNGPFMDKKYIIHDYIAVRDMLKGNLGVHPEILYSYCGKVETQMLNYIREIISLGTAISTDRDKRVIVSDIGISAIRRKKVMKELGGASGNFYSTCLYLIGSHSKMIERNDSYIEYSKDFEEYLASSQEELPSFQEGFNTIIIINETKESDRNFKSSVRLEDSYRRIYGESVAIHTLSTH